MRGAEPPRRGGPQLPRPDLDFPVTPAGGDRGTQKSGNAAALCDAGQGVLQSRRGPAPAGPQPRCHPGGTPYGCTPTAGSSQDPNSACLNTSHGYISYAVFCFKNKNLPNLL